MFFKALLGITTSLMNGRMSNPCLRGGVKHMCLTITMDFGKHNKMQYEVMDLDDALLQLSCMTTRHA